MFVVLSRNISKRVSMIVPIYNGIPKSRFY